MKISDIVKCTATYLARENVIEYLEGNTEISGDAMEQVDLMVRSVNLVINELADSFVPMIKTEKLSAENGKVYYSRFSESALEILSVTDADGREAGYEFSAEYLKTSADPAVVTYKFLPPNYDLNDSAEFSKPVSARILAYGAAAEICLIERNFEESVCWRKRYADSVAKLTCPKSFLSARRRWA